MRPAQPEVCMPLAALTRSPAQASRRPKFSMATVQSYTSVNWTCSQFCDTCTDVWRHGQVTIWQDSSEAWAQHRVQFSKDIRTGVGLSWPICTERYKCAADKHIIAITLVIHPLVAGTSSLTRVAASTCQLTPQIPELVFEYLQLQSLLQTRCNGCCLDLGLVEILQQLLIVQQASL